MDCTSYTLHANMNIDVELYDCFMRRYDGIVAQRTEGIQLGGKDYDNYAVLRGDQP